MRRFYPTFGNVSKELRRAEEIFKNVRLHEVYENYAFPRLHLRDLKKQAH